MYVDLLYSTSQSQRSLIRRTFYTYISLLHVLHRTYVPRNSNVTLLYQLTLTFNSIFLLGILMNELYEALATSWLFTFRKPHKILLATCRQVKYTDHTQSMMQEESIYLSFIVIYIYIYIVTFLWLYIVINHLLIINLYATAFSLFILFISLMFIVCLPALYLRYPYSDKPFILGTLLQYYVSKYYFHVMITFFMQCYEWKSLCFSQIMLN